MTTEQQYLGLKGEFQNIGGKPLPAVIDNHLTIWNLKPEDSDHALTSQPPPFHEFGHQAAAFCALLPPQTDTMKEKIENLKYQGDVYMESFVLAIQSVMTDIQNGYFPADNQDITKESLKAHLQEALANEPRENNLTLGTNGRKATYFLGKFSQPPKPMQDIREEYAYNDNALINAAMNRAEELGAVLDNYLHGHIRHGDSYIANGTEQTYEDVGKFSEDPDAPVMADRATHMIMHNLHHIQNTQSEQETIDAMTIDDIIDGAAQSETVDLNADPELIAEIMGTTYETDENVIA